MYYFLSNQGYLVHVINPIQYDAVRNLYIYENRTNCEDTSILADLLQMNQTEETFMVSEAVLKLQILSWTHFAFMDQASTLRQHVTSILDRVFH